MTFREGDYFYCRDEDERPVTYSPFYCLRRDDELNIAHVMAFGRTSEPPSKSNLASLEIFARHMPIATDGFGETVVFASKPVDGEDLDAYLEYLRANRYALYLRESGQDADAIMNEAIAEYDAGNEYCDRGEFEQSIPRYARAMKLFPPLYEAADNAAFALMDLGEPEQAIGWFEKSIATNGNTYLTDMSIAECYIQIGDAAKARSWIEKAAAHPDISNEDRDVLSQFRERVKRL